MYKMIVDMLIYFHKTYKTVKQFMKKLPSIGGGINLRGAANIEMMM